MHKVHSSSVFHVVLCYICVRRDPHRLVMSVRRLAALHRLPGLGTTVDEVLLAGAAKSLSAEWSRLTKSNSSLSSHGGVKEQESHVGLLLGLRESLQRNEVLLLPVEQLGVHV